MYVQKWLFTIISAVFVLTGADSAWAQSGIPGEVAAGRWDISIENSGGTMPAWLEIKPSGASTLVGRYVGPAGSARPISRINYSAESDSFHFTIPPQWIGTENDHRFEFSLKDDKLTGWTTGYGSERLKWTAERAPSLLRENQPEWAEPINLLDKELSKWEMPENNRFRMENDILVNEEAGGNLVTRQKFGDFKLHMEFRYPEGSNSGVYLRGRYEVQISDSYGDEPDSHNIGGIYGFIDPATNAAKKAGEWQSFDITLTGRQVTVVHNGTEIICNRPIPGITGGALDSHENEPGPLMLQGDHGPIEFRKIILTPALDK